MSSPALPFAQQVSANTTTWTLGENLFTGGKRPYGKGVPHFAAFMTLTGGGKGRAIKQDDGTIERAPRLEVWVRGHPPSVKRFFAIGEDAAIEILNALDAKPPVGICECRSASSYPDEVGPDADGHPEWFIAFDVIQDYTP
jgi:hypothetical protein